MGYTRFWERTSKPFDDDFVDFCVHVLDTCKKLGITIRGAHGINYPVVNTDMIALNGDATRGDKNLACESFVLDDTTGFDFCKTARMPYDYAVRTILREAFVRGYVTDLSSDGDNEDIVSDNEY